MQDCPIAYLLYIIHRSNIKYIHEWAYKLDALIFRGVSWWENCGFLKSYPDQYNQWTSQWRFKAMLRTHAMWNYIYIYVILYIFHFLLFHWSVLILFILHDPHRVFYCLYEISIIIPLLGRWIERVCWIYSDKNNIHVIFNIDVVLTDVREGYKYLHYGYKATFLYIFKIST